MAIRVSELPLGDWIYEMKFDWYSALAFKADQEVRLDSRNRNSFKNELSASRRFPESRFKRRLRKAAKGSAKPVETSPKPI